MKETEGITNLERFELLIEDCEGHRELYGEFSVGEYDIEIMQHILSDYKRVLKENEELNKKILSNTGIYQLGFKDGEESYIKKVKDKIKEYKNMLKTCNKAKDVDRIKAINERILELEELLG